LGAKLINLSPKTNKPDQAPKTGATLRPQFFYFLLQIQTLKKHIIYSHSIMVSAAGQTLVNLQDGVSYSVQLNSSLVFRIATPYKYAQLNISVITPSSSLQYQISKGWIPTLPVAGPGGAAPSASGSVSNSSSASLIVRFHKYHTLN
jgi:hypothetical protein